MQCVVLMVPFPKPPRQIERLFKGESPESAHFLKHIRQYNSAFQMTSFGCNEVTLRGWNPSFRVQGQVCHLIGPLEPASQALPSFLQIYFMDGNMATDRRLSVTDGLNRDLVLLLQNELNLTTYNRHVQQLKSSYEFARSNRIETFSIVIREANRPLHARDVNTTHQSAMKLLFLCPMTPSAPETLFYINEVVS